MFGRIAAVIVNHSLAKKVVIVIDFLQFIATKCLPILVFLIEFSAGVLIPSS
jgi:hypothetical protein